MKKYKTGTLFPNTNDTVAYYSPTAFCITLLTISENRLRSINHKNTDHVNDRKILYHEIRHNIDHLSTLWGQKKIYSLFDAINARLELNENDFHKIISYKISEKQLKFDKYYLEKYRDVEYNSPNDAWGWQLSSGVRYDDAGNPRINNPILFISFHNNSRQKIMRVPISVATLLETNAVYEETIIEQEILQSADTKLRPKIRLYYDKKMFKSIIYNQDMVLYNSTVHLCANLLNISDCYLAFDIASTISNIVLNLSNDTIKEIPINSEELKEWGDRPNDFIKNHDYGFLYYNMLNNYKDLYKEEKTFNLESFLSINKLPSKDNLEKQVLTEIEQINAQYNKGIFHTFFKNQSNAGLEIFKLRGIDGKKATLREVLLSGHYIPFVVASNTSFNPRPNTIEIVRKKPTEVNIIDWYFLSHDINVKMEELYEIRGL